MKCVHLSELSCGNLHINDRYSRRKKEFRLRADPLSVFSPSCLTRKKIAREKTTAAWTELLEARSTFVSPQDFTRPFFILVVFFHVTHDRLNESGTTLSLKRVQFSLRSYGSQSPAYRLIACLILIRYKHWITPVLIPSPDQQTAYVHTYKNTLMLNSYSRS